MTKLLALDTSSDACSVALQVGDVLREEHVVKAKEHTQILIPMIRSLLQDANVDLKELDAIVLGNGPGSFIGMRIAASVAQGLAFGAGLRIVPVSSMAAIAAEVMASREADEVVVAQDAHMNEAYLGIYRRGDDDQPHAISAEWIQGIEKIDELSDAGRAVRCAAGQAWRRYPALVARNEPLTGELTDVSHPKARYLLGLAARWRDLAIEPGMLEPAYIRVKVAQVPARA